MEIKPKKKKSMCKAVVFLKATFIRLSTHGVLPHISFSTSKKLLLLLRFSVLYGRTWVFLPPPDASYPHGEVSRMHEETGNDTLERGPFPLFFFFLRFFSWEVGQGKGHCEEQLHMYAEVKVFYGAPTREDPGGGAFVSFLPGPFFPFFLGTPS